jgi:biotin carboxyl carrier protein
MENYNTQKALLDRTVSMQQTNYENTLALYEIGAASRLEVDAAELQYLSAIAQRDATLSQLASAMSSQQSGYLQMNAAMQGADANGNVIAPVSGTVTSVSATVGSTVSATKPIAVIDAAGQMNISVSVSEALLPKLAVGDMASVSVSSLSLEFDALITAIDRASSLQTQLYGVTLSVPEEIEGLRPGTFADVSFHHGQGLYFSADKFSLSVSHYSPKLLTNTAHAYELKPEKETTVIVDYRNAGIGSESCGPKLLPEYTISEREIDFTFNIKSVFAPDVSPFDEFVGDN